MKYTYETAKNCPEKHLKQIYDKNDSVLFGTRFIKGKVIYHYVPDELMESNTPYLIIISIKYDGKGNIDLPKDSTIMEFKDLPKVFIDNTFTINEKQDSTKDSY